MRKMGTKMEPILASIQMPKPSPARKGKENRVIVRALPARRVLKPAPLKAAFQEAISAMTRPAQARLQTESQTERNAVPNRLTVDCNAAIPSSAAMLKAIPGMRKRLLVKK